MGNSTKKKTKLNINVIKRWIKWGLIPLTLFLFWLASLVVFSSQESFSIVSIDHGKENFQNISPEELLKGNKITGRIEAKENNFGILSIRFETPKDLNIEDQDDLIFRIKEEGHNVWITENNYKSGILDGSPLFPFGFDKIKDSKGKIYLFEVESLNGNNTNAISLKLKKPFLITKYDFQKNDILSNPNNFIDFAIKKTKGTLGNVEAVINSLPYLLPFIFYMLFFSYYDKLKNRKTDNSLLSKLTQFLFLHFIVIFIIFFSLTSTDNLHFSIYLIILFLWFLVIIYYKLDSSITFLYSGLFLLISLIAVVLEFESIVKNISSWAYLLLLVGVIQSVWEFNKKDIKRLDYKDYLSVVFNRKF